MGGTVLFLGAGATKSAQGLLTNEILPRLWTDRAALQAQDPTGKVDALVDFLAKEFHVTSATPQEGYPGLPLLLSLLDTALDRRETFHAPWDLDAIAKLREAIEFGIYDLLEEALKKAPTNNHYSMLYKLYPTLQDQPCVISTNYDLIADSAMMYVSKAIKPPDGGLPNYHCGIANVSQLRTGATLRNASQTTWIAELAPL